MDHIALLNRLEILFWNLLISLMQNRRRARMAILSILLAVVLAVGSILSMTAGNRSAAQIDIPTTGRSDSGNSNSQSTILVIVVDQLSKPKILFKPELRGIWMVAALPGSPRLTFMPLYPNSLKGGVEGDLLLASKFDVRLNNLPSSNFLNYLRSKDIEFDHYVLTDQAALGRFVEMVGGIHLEPVGFTDDKEVINNLVLSTQQPQSQAALINAICDRSGDLFQRVNPEQVSEILPANIYSDRGWNLEKAWPSIYRDGASYTCEFPTLSVSGVEPGF